mmetsp:Transcript_2068/g.4748  ORF Transcript_2068/g.4748 Transcript_2068/m.4748 type:complete len:462 (-) Transcript_2068:6893-8278(-)
MDDEVLANLVKEYLKFQGFNQTLESFERELTTSAFRKFSKTDEALAALPKLYQFTPVVKVRSAREEILQKQLTALEKNYSVMMAAGKHLLALGLDVVQRLPPKNDVASGFKSQLGKFHALFVAGGADSAAEGEEINETEILEIKANIIRGLKERDLNLLKSQLAQVRTRALQVSHKHRRRFIDYCVKHDVLASNPSSLLKKGDIAKVSLPVLSMLASSSRGVYYLLRKNREQVVGSLVLLAQESPDSSLSQRFAVAVLQKLTVYDDAICRELLESGFGLWVMREFLVKNVLDRQFVHSFLLDYGSSLLANLINTESGRHYFENRHAEALEVMESLLEMLKVPSLESSVIIHLLIVLSVLSSEQHFAELVEETNFKDHIAEFLELYSARRPEAENEDPESHSTVLDMCAHLFHVRSSLDTSEVMEYNATKHQEEIRELEKQLDDHSEALVFECFPDEFLDDF